MTLQALQDYCRLLPGLLTAELVKSVVQLTVAGRLHGEHDSAGLQDSMLCYRREQCLLQHAVALTHRVLQTSEPVA